MADGGDDTAAAVAVRYLTRTVRNIASPYEAALIILALGRKAVKKRLCDGLVPQVIGGDAEWIAHGPLRDVMVRLLALKRYAPDRISGGHMAILARRLEKSALRAHSPFVREIIDPIRRTLQDGKRVHAADRRFASAYARTAV